MALRAPGRIASSTSIRYWRGIFKGIKSIWPHRHAVLFVGQLPAQLYASVGGNAALLAEAPSGDRNGSQLDFVILIE